MGRQDRRKKLAKSKLALEGPAYHGKSFTSFFIFNNFILWLNFCVQKFLTSFNKTRDFLQYDTGQAINGQNKIKHLDKCSIRWIVEILKN